MSFCLIKSETQKLKKALKDGELNPVTLSQMSSEQRVNELSKYIDKNNAKEVVAQFESKLLLKNQKAGMISWAKKILGITPKVRQDLLTRIGRLENVLSVTEEKAFLNELANRRLGLEVTQEEANTIADLYKRVEDTKSKAKEDGTFPSETDRLAYGLAQVELQDYINDLKVQARSISLREKPLQKVGRIIGEAPGTLKSILASLDNSFFGRQGIKVLMNPRTSKVWFKNFLKSWGDIATELRGRDAIKAIKADIYSRPNALNGKYQAGGYGLNVMNEEAFPSSFPEKIPVFKRLYKASESAYNGAALRMRADLADRIITLAEKNGVNTLDKDQAKALGNLVSSFTGRGSLGKWEVGAKDINNIFFSIKFLKSNLDTLTAGWTDSKIRQNKFARKEAAKNLLGIVATTAFILTMVRLLDPDSVDEDPRSSNFGKVKIFGLWTDITGGMGAIVRTAMRVTPVYRDGEWGFWYKNSAGEYKRLNSGEYGSTTALDMVEGFFEGKLSPIAGVLRDIWAGKTYSGDKVTVPNVIKNITIPLPAQNFYQMLKNPNASSVVGSMILDGLGFSVSTVMPPNSKTQIIPEGEKISNDDFIKTALLYAQAMGTDPETAFNRIFTGQKIRKVSGDAIIVERMSVDESQEVKKKAGADNPEMRLDHQIPLTLGGDNSLDNLKVVTKSEWSSYTKVETALGRALEKKKISKKDAQSLIKEFKSIQDTNKRKEFGDEIIVKYK